MSIGTHKYILTATAGYITSATNGQLLWCPNTNMCTGAYYRAQDLEAGTVADFFTWQDQNSIGGAGTHWNNGGNAAIGTWLLNRASAAATPTTSTYNLYEDQVTLAGEVYTDTHFANFTNGNKRVIAMAVIPIENFAPSSVFDDYHYPNFIPTNFWSYGEVGVDYCQAMGLSESSCVDYENQNRASEREKYYRFASYALDRDTHILTDRFENTSNTYVPEGMSLWWQVLNPSGVGVGLWAQISFKDSYDGASGSTTRDDQESLLNVIISNIDYRKNDTTRYSAGDTGLGMDGYHYWSYQGATNTDSNGLGINYGTSPVECATSNDSGCFWGDTNYTHSTNRPGGAMFTSSDPYKSGDMTLGVNYNSDTDQFSTGTFNISAVTQSIRKGSGYVEAVSLSDFRSSDFYDSSASSYSGFFSGILEFNDLTLLVSLKPKWLPFAPAVHLLALPLIPPMMICKWWPR